MHCDLDRPESILLVNRVCGDHLLESLLDKLGFRALQVPHLYNELLAREGYAHQQVDVKLLAIGCLHPKRLRHCPELQLELSQLWKVRPEYLWRALIKVSDREFCNSPRHNLLAEKVLRREQPHFQSLQPVERQPGLVIGGKCPKVERLIQVQLLEMSAGADREDLPRVPTLRPGLTNCDLA